MKRSVAIVLTAAIFAAIAFAFLRSMPDSYIALCQQLNPDFGFRYIYDSAEIEFYDVTGDVDKLRPIRMTREIWWHSDDLAPRMIFECPEGSKIAFTKYKYTDGKFDDERGEDSKAYDMGYSEKLNKDGEWEFFGSSGLSLTFGLLNREPEFGASLPSDKDAKNIVGDGKVARWRTTYLPWYDPGSYRVTLYFRDCTNYGHSHYATGDELYSVSYCFDVPDYPSNRRFDVLYVDRYDRHDGEHRVSFAIRANEGEPPYLSSHLGVQIEQFVDGEFVNIGYADEPREDPRYTRYDWRVYDSAESTPARYKTFAELSLDEEYRLTFFFSENDDGTGEQWEFVLPLLPDYPPLNW